MGWDEGEGRVERQAGGGTAGGSCGRRVVRATTATVRVAYHGQPLTVVNVVVHAASITHTLTLLTQTHCTHTHTHQQPTSSDNHCANLTSQSQSYFSYLMATTQAFNVYYSILLHQKHNHWEKFTPKIE